MSESSLSLSDRREEILRGSEMPDTIASGAGEGEKEIEMEEKRSALRSQITIALRKLVSLRVFRS